MGWKNWQINKLEGIPPSDWRDIMKVSRDFKGIWIPKGIWLDKNLTIQEKVFLAEIDSLEGENGCFASNAYFAEFFGLSKERVRKIIAELVEKGYITNELIYKEGTKEVDKRILKVRLKPYGGGGDINHTPMGENDHYITKNNITKNKYNYQEIIDYLNEKTGKTYKAVKTNNQLINARYEEGYTLEDFKAVIDYKTSKWKGTEWEKYLRPSTLFSAKNFENYVNEAPRRSIECTSKEVEEGEFTNFLDIMKKGGLE